MSQEERVQPSIAERLTREHGVLWFFKTNLQNSIKTIRHYVESVSSSFDGDSRENEELVDVRLKAALDADEAQNIHDEYSSRRFLLKYEFPTFALETTFVAMHSQLEDQLSTLCEFVGKRLNINLNLEDLSHKGIFRAKIYLEKLCGIPFPEETHAWQQVLHYNRVRNVVVHSRGLLKTEKTEGIRKYVESKGRVLTLTNNRLNLTKEFCLEVLDNIEALFMDLVRLAQERLKPAS